MIGRGVLGHAARFDLQAIEVDSGGEVHVASLQEHAALLAKGRSLQAAPPPATGGSRS